MDTLRTFLEQQPLLSQEQRRRRQRQCQQAHGCKACQALARADRAWLAGLIARRERPEDFEGALDRWSEDPDNSGAPG